MSETTTFPRRDAEGRVVSLVELLVGLVVGVLLGALALLLIDGLFALVGLGRFGELSGWLAGILPIWLFIEEYRAWRAVPARIVLALVGVLLAVALALGGARLAAESLPPLGSGAIGALVAALVYGAVWFVGIRWLADRSSS